MSNRYCPNSPWTDEAVKRLKEIWMQYPASKIAEILNQEFGNRFTAETISLKAARLKLPRKLRGTFFAPRSAKRSAAEKNIQPVRFIPRICVEPTKEQIEADRKLIAEHIKNRGVTVCPPAHFVPIEHVFNRVAKPNSRM